MSANLKLVSWPFLFTHSRNSDKAVAVMVEGPVDPQSRTDFVHALALTQADIRSTATTVTTTPVAIPSTASTILVNDDTAGGPVTVSLPLASTGNGFWLNIKKLGSTGNVVINATGGATIDGAATQTLVLQYENLTVLSDGTNWHVL